ESTNGSSREGHPPTHHPTTASHTPPDRRGRQRDVRRGGADATGDEPADGLMGGIDEQPTESGDGPADENGHLSRSSRSEGSSSVFPSRGLSKSSGRRSAVHSWISSSSRTMGRAGCSGVVLAAPNPP